MELLLDRDQRRDAEDLHSHRMRFEVESGRRVANFLENNRL
jgi:hypothetical protein